MLARFDAAQTTKENAAHWSMATGYDADTEASPTVRSIIRRRARYESANNSSLRGMISKHANYVIGTGPRLQLSSENQIMNHDIEADFLAWSKEINLGRKLRIAVMAEARDGEVFLMLIYNKKLNTKIKLDIRVLEADRIRGDYQTMSNDDEVDGIFYDEIGNPIEYNVMPHPGGNDFSVEGKRVPADYMIHLFSEERPEQHRGVSMLTSALPAFAMLRRYTLAMIKKMESSANIAGVIQTNELADEIEPDALGQDAFEPFSLPRDGYAALPRGYNLKDHMTNNPLESQNSFAEQVKIDSGQTLNLPKNAALGDSSSYNYASGQLDFQAYKKYLTIEQADIANIALAKIMKLWFREYWPQQIKYRRDDYLVLSWFWDGTGHVNPLVEANAQKQRLDNKSTNLAIECASQGRDWEDVQDQRLKEEFREIRKRKEMGLPPKTTESDYEY